MLEWITEAKRLALEQQHAWVGLRHLIGALIFAPDFHIGELTRWGFDRAAWATDFVNYGAASLPEDLNFWIDIDRRVFRTDRPRSPGPRPIPAEVPARLEDAFESRRAVPRSPELLFDPTAPPEWLPGFANDGVDGEQFINTKADVQSIARVMCMKDVSPLRHATLDSQ